MITTQNPFPKNRITTALLLAAGTGSRLFPLTQESPKCLTLVNETSILERLIRSLNQHGFKRLVVVTGHLEDCIRDFLETRAGNIEIEYVFSPQYKTTNNMVSLWMARKIVNEPFLLIESDLVFDPALLTDMLVPDRIAVARMKPWLNGSTVSIDSSNRVEAFYGDSPNDSGHPLYKTVNIYSLSASSWHRIIEKLDQHILSGRVNDYYEVVFRQLVAEKELSFKAVFFDQKPWYEIDTIEDLVSAEKLFPATMREPFSVYKIQPGQLKAAEVHSRTPKLKGNVHART